MVRKSFLICGLFAAAFFAAHPTEAQQGAPKVRLTTLPTTVISTVEPSVSLSEPAFLFVLAVDNGGQIEVLSPSLPSDAIRFEAAKSIRIPEFFAGFSTASNYGEYGYRSRLSSFASYGDAGATNGSVLVVASRTPFNFSAISDGIYWNEDAIRQIIRFRNPSQSVSALGRVLTEKGQQFGHDYVYFGRAGYSQFASSSFRAENNCVMDYSFTPFGYSSFTSYYGVSGASYGQVILAGNGNMGGLALMRVGTDGCGQPRYMLVPVQTLPPRDTVKIDSVVTRTFRSANAGVYEGEAARRVYDVLVRHRNSSDTYVGLVSSPVFTEKEDKTLGRPVNRAAEPDRVESYARVRAADTRPINRMPVIRGEPANSALIPHSQPVSRAEPVMQMHSAPAMREAKPAEVVSRVKDN